ncbi:UDP-sugar hydrolase [Tenacibaculum sp. E3R01]|uniref:5'-nucleotidase C-terminal domain-containing protein n=1 Tax=Tenacibaculum sp. E3R01 TaxID=2267227 RepID=UPI000DE8A516|nr:5'-nucleotidase C-terminal domain-containing protein [Tenacibaculum sp. E3R01]RBW62426.1 UDP-sugar hydrolase [Tenacibaculum sp. E3R01]
MKLSYLFCFFLAITSCKKNKTHLTKITAKTIAIDSTIQSSEKIDDTIAPYKKKLADNMSKVLSYTPEKLTRQGINMQSNLGNLLADLCIEMAAPIFKEKSNTSIDFSMFNHGGIRATIPAGKITKEHAFKLMPFENELVVAEITGNKVIELVNYFIENKVANPLSKNIELTIKENNYSLKINGEIFDKNKTYSVLTSDFLQGGGDKMIFFKNPKKLTKLNYKVRDAIINYFKKVDTLKTSIDNRIIIK